MEAFRPEISFALPANFKFETFSGVRTLTATSSSVLQQESHGNGRGLMGTFIATTAANNQTVLRKLSEKFGRGLSSNDIIVHHHRNQVILNGTAAATLNGEWITQMEYDKFMNEIWIGIVLTLIVISLVFCVCSCFLYHQFRQWKRNFRYNVAQSYDIESLKLNLDDDESLPSYTIVSGLPSYDDAIEQLQKSSNSNCFFAYPSVHTIFTVVDTKEYFVEDVTDGTASSTSDNIKEQVVITAPPVPSYEEAISSTSFASEPSLKSSCRIENEIKVPPHE